VKSEAGPPMTLGNAAAARVPLSFGARDARHRTEPIPPRRERLVCSKCGSRKIDIVVSGTKRGADS